MNRKSKQSAPKAQCIKNTVIIFSIAAICMAWAYLIYESMHRTSTAAGPNSETIAALTSDMNKGIEAVTTATVTPPTDLNFPVVIVPPPPATIAPEPIKAKLNFREIHFIHIPKCGGTSMSAVLRQLMCQRDPQNNVECCTNPGFCDFHAHRRCPVIKGCINHFPHRPIIFKPIPSIAIFRHPVSRYVSFRYAIDRNDFNDTHKYYKNRLISAYFYRGHSPNNDFFQVRPEFKEIRQGKRPKVSFGEYLEMHEYNNIMTRMLGADSFPYRNVTVDETLYNKAIEAVDRIFFVGIQEVYDYSVELLLREFDMKLSIELPKERQDTANKKLKQDKDNVKNNALLMQRAEQVNYYDMRLYNYVLKRFCGFKIKYPEFMDKMRERHIECPLLLSK